MPNLPSKLLPVMAAALLIGGCSRTPPDEEVLVRVNDRTVSVAEFHRAFNRMASSLGDPPENSARRTQGQVAFLDQTIEHLLVADAAERMGVGVSTAELRAEVEKLTAGFEPGVFEKMLADRYVDRPTWEEDVRRRLLARKAIAKALGEKVRVSEEEARAYYEEHASDYSHPREVHARQILVKNEALAQEIRKKILRGASFDEMAREHSLSPDARDGGDLGFFAAGTMPSEFDNEVFRLRPRQLSRVVVSPYGYHLFWVDEIREPRTVPFEEARDEIISRLRERKLQEAYRKWVQELRGKAEIEIHYERLNQS